MSRDAPVPTADEHDPVVHRALRELPVPEHRLTFWAELNAAIAESAGSSAVDGAAVDGAAAADLEPQRSDADDVPTLRRAAPQRSSGRRAAPWLAAAAGLAVVGGAAGFLLTRDDAGDGEVAGVSSTPAPATTDIVPSTTTVEVTTTVPVATTVVAAGDPADVTRAFIDALGAGEAAEALALLGPRSTAYIESTGADPLAFVTEMQEGYGAWAGADDVEITATSAGVVAPLEGELSIVTVQGTHPGEGSPSPRVDAFPLVREGDRWVIELVALADGRNNRLRFTVPPSDSDGVLGGMAPDGEINVFVPTQGTVLFQIDGGEVFADETADIPAGVFSLHAPPQPLGNGTHTLVAVAVGADGTITPFGGTFTVEG